VPTFVMLSNLGPDGFARMKEQPHRLEEVNLEAEALGVHVVAQYAILGPFDFLTIVEAPDELTMSSLATMLAARGTMKPTTYMAIPADEYIAKLQSEL
jgi:uncharacterized protein with GYD domain